MLLEVKVGQAVESPAPPAMGPKAPHAVVVTFPEAGPAGVGQFDAGQVGGEAAVVVKIGTYARAATPGIRSGSPG